MAYRIEAGEAVEDGLRRVVTEEIASAAAQLTGKGAPNRDEAIHEARKSVKKIRGVLRLIEPALGDAFETENARMRSIGRRLSGFRDAAASIETFDAMKEKYREDLSRHTLASVRRGLLARKKQGENQTPIQPVLSRIAATLSSAERRVQTWPIGAGFRAIEPGLEGTFRGGRKAMARAREHPSPENDHEWRKRAKDHWYQVRLLESLWTKEIESYEKSLKHLEGLLGDEHNVVVLREKVVADPAFYGKEAEVAFFLDLLDRYRKELREGALSDGEQVYKEKPRQYAKRMRRLWEAAPNRTL
jgi:CHAD domain-containing protein